MKKIIVFFILNIIVFTSCKENNKEPLKTYAIFSGKIKNLKSNTIRILGKGIQKNIKVNEDGSFKDTIKIKNITSNGLVIDQLRPTIYLKNGYSLHLIGDAKDIKTFNFTGIGSKENDFLLSQFLYGSKVSELSQDFFTLENEEFKSKINEFEKGLDSISNKFKDIDSTLINLTEKQNQKVFQLITSLYETQHKSIKANLKAIEGIKKGSINTPFINLESFEGIKYSQKDFKGSYLFIDFWNVSSYKYFKELPQLNKIKNKYRNIKYVSICLENSRTSGTWSYAKDKWRKKVEEEKLTGIQLFAGDNNTFLKDYYVFSMPRIIIIDPKGKVVTPKAPKLDSPEMLKLLNKINNK